MRTTSQQKPQLKDNQGVQFDKTLHLHAQDSTNTNDKAIDSNATTNFKHSFSNMPVHSGGPVVQTKLSVNEPGDKYEQEADAMADMVMRMQETPSIQRGGEDEEKKQLLRKPVSTNITPVIQARSESGAIVSPELSNKISSSQGSGNCMDKNTQLFMSNRFDADFNKVKIHNDNEAMKMNRELNAKAFTIGNDIYFNEGEYQPDLSSGKHLLVHELTHTIQQGNNRLIQKKDDPKKRSFKDQKLKDGQGDIQYQQYFATVKGSKVNFKKFATLFTTSPQSITNNFWATYVPVDTDKSRDLSETDIINIKIAADDGSVRVVYVKKNEDSFEIKFQTLEGHPEAGDIIFKGTYIETNDEEGEIQFSITNQTRQSLGVLRYLVPYVSECFGRFAQQDQWKEVLANFGSYLRKDLHNYNAVQYTMDISTVSWDEEKEASGKFVDAKSLDVTKDVLFKQKRYYLVEKAKKFLIQEKAKKVLDIIYATALADAVLTNIPENKDFTAYKYKKGDYSVAQGPKNEKKKNYVNATNEVILVKEGKKAMNKDNFAVVLLRNFINGTGPENYVFGQNSEISLEMKKSVIFRDALRKWYEKNEMDIKAGNKIYYQEIFGDFKKNEAAEASIDGILGIEDLVGSANFRIYQIDKSTFGVFAVNITSLSSGDLLKELGLEEATSIPRNLSNPHPQAYSNISQTFHFTFRIEEIKGIIKKSAFEKVKEHIMSKENK